MSKVASTTGDTIGPRSAVRRIAHRTIQLVDHVVPASRRTVVLVTSPDLDDNVVALLRAAPGTGRVTVLAHDLARARSRARALDLHPHFVPRHSVRGLWAYLRSRAVITSHGVFGCHRRPPWKRTVGLWHGEFGKLIGRFAGEPARHFDWVPVSGALSRSHRAAEFDLDPGRIHVVGTPRQQLLAPSSHDRLPPGPHVVWAPTYRRSVTQHVRNDGDTTLDRADLLADDTLHQVLAHHGATLWYRPHPAAAPPSLPEDSRVELASDEDLERWRVTFYDLLAASTCLVTDYSSVWIDYVLRDGPLIGYCPDLDTYRADRGLALEPHEVWFPGPITLSAQELTSELDAVLSGADPSAAQRRVVRSALHARFPHDAAAEVRRAAGLPT